MFVVKGLKTNLLGLPTITALNLAVRVDVITDVSEKDIPKQFPSLFQGLGSLGEEYNIQLKPEAKPFAIFTPRHVPLPLRTKVQEELDRMESLGVISRVDQQHHGARAWLLYLRKMEPSEYVSTSNPSMPMYREKFIHYLQWMRL